MIVVANISSEQDARSGSGISHRHPQSLGLDGIPTHPDQPNC